MACCRALALQLLPASAHSRSRINFRRRIRCCAAAGDQVEAPQDAVLKAISQVASSKGRIAQTTNVIMGGTVTDDTTDEWLALDKKVNTYPTVRGFTAIGTGGDDFVHSMVVAVESIIEERIPEDTAVTTKQQPPQTPTPPHRPLIVTGVDDDVMDEDRKDFIPPWQRRHLHRAHAAGEPNPRKGTYNLHRRTKASDSPRIRGPEGPRSRRNRRPRRRDRQKRTVPIELGK